MIRLATHQSSFRLVEVGTALLRAGSKIGDRLAFGDDAVSSRAVAMSGLAALVSLPFLMLASIVLEAPIAIPAAVATGYLAQSTRGRTAMRLLVPLGLLVWMLAFLLGRQEITDAGYVAALLAPLFAAAPAFAISIHRYRESAVRRKPVSSARTEAKTCRVELEGRATQPAGAPKREVGLPAVAAGSPLRATTASAELEKAVDFAIARVQRSGSARRLPVRFVCTPGIYVACDRQILRLIAGHLLELACGSTSREVQLTARRVRGIALLCATVDSDRLDVAENTAERTVEVLAVRELVEKLGGTLVADRSGGRVAWTVRLDLASEVCRSAA